MGRPLVTPVSCFCFLTFESVLASASWAVHSCKAVCPLQELQGGTPQLIVVVRHALLRFVV